MQDVPSHTRAQGEASFMEEPDGCDELDGSAHDECDESSFTIDQVNPEDLKVRALLLWLMVDTHRIAKAKTPSVHQTA